MNRQGMRGQGSNRPRDLAGYSGPRSPYRSPHESEGADWLPTLAGVALVLSGSYLLYRGFGSAPREERGRGLEVRASVTIDRPARELYRYWRSLEKLPTIMSHLKSVEVLAGNRSRWTAKGPLNSSVTWEAETVDEREGERLAWRSVAGTTVPNEGSVAFRKAPGARGTEVHVSLTYHPPLGAVGAGVAKLFGEAPSQQIREDLRRFKQRLEAGEIATTEGQPSGRA